MKKIFAESQENYGPDLLKDPEGSLVVKKKLLSDLIEEKILLLWAQEKGIGLSREEETQLTEELKSGYSPVEFEKMLRQKQISFEDWLVRQRNKKRIEKLIAQEVTSKISLEPQEIEDYYKNRYSRFREPDRVRCRHIVASKREKAETILSLLNRGENFAAVAQKFSESPDRDRGGDLGYVTREGYPLLFVAACFTLNTGQTSGVVPSEYGFHIFRVVEKKPGRQLSLSEAAPEIERRLKEEKGRQALKPWLDELYRNKKIRVDEKAFKEVLLTP